jgi:hypothetical protein
VNGRVLRALSYSGPEVTPAYCSELCWAYGYTYAGVEYGDECYVSCIITPSFVSLTIWFQCDSSLAYAGPIVDDTNCRSPFLSNAVLSNSFC